MFTTDDDIDDENESTSEDDSLAELEEDIQVLTSLTPEHVAETIESTDVPVLTTREIQKLAKERREFIKRYFSSFTARRSPVTYFGVGDDDRTILHSNTAGQYFVNRMASELGVHVMQFKQQSDWDKIEELKRTLLMHVPGRVYQARVANYIAQVNKWKLDNVRVWQDGTKVVCTPKQYDNYDLKKQLVSVPINNFHLMTAMKSHYKAILTIEENEEYRDTHIEVELSKDPNLTGITTYASIPVDTFTDANGQQIFKDFYPTLQPILFDGIGTPSTKEFVKKNPDATYKLCAWVAEGSYVRYMVVYEDEHVLVKSMKPSSYLYPIPMYKYNALKGAIHG